MYFEHFKNQNIAKIDLNFVLFSKSAGIASMKKAQVITFLIVTLSRVPNCAYVSIMLGSFSYPPPHTPSR